MLSSDLTTWSANTPVPSPSSTYWLLYDEVADAQLADWVPRQPSRILDLSDDGPGRAALLRDLGHEVVRVGNGPLPGVTTVLADARSLDWLGDASFDAVVAESRLLSRCLAAEETARDLARVLRTGGALLLVVDSLAAGLAQLAEQGRWAELADTPAADLLLVADQDGTLSRCFAPEELASLLQDSGLEVQWVRPRTVLTPAAVERALATGSRPAALRALVRTELALAVELEGESAGLHLVASAVAR